MSDDWLNSLGPEQRAKALQWIEYLRRCEAPSPEDLVKADLIDNIPRIVQFFLLRMLAGEVEAWHWLSNQLLTVQKQKPEDWQDNPFADVTTILEKMKQAGISESEIGNVTQWVAYEAICQTLELIEIGNFSHFPGSTNWELMETDPDGEPTGRTLKGLKQGLLPLIDFKGSRNEG